MGVESFKRAKWELDSRNLFMKHFGSFNGSVFNPNADSIDVSSLPTTFKQVRLHDFKMQPALALDQLQIACRVIYSRPLSKSTTHFILGRTESIQSFAFNALSVSPDTGTVE